MKIEKLCVEKVNGGYVVQPLNDYYSKYGDATVYVSFIEMIKCFSETFGEESFARSIESSNALTQAFTVFIEAALKPQFLAIESRLNPGVENVKADQSFDDDDIKF